MKHQSASMAHEVLEWSDDLYIMPGSLQRLDDLGTDPIFDLEAGGFLPQVLPRSQRGAVTACWSGWPKRTCLEKIIACV